MHHGSRKSRVSISSHMVAELAYCGRLDSLAGWHGDDLFTEGEPGALDEVDVMILASFKAKVLPRLGPGASTDGTTLRRILRW